jgi:hypothetical protein
MAGYTKVIAKVAQISIEQGTRKIHKLSCAVDCGQMVNPRIVESQISGGIGEPSVAIRSGPESTSRRSSLSMRQF